MSAAVFWTERRNGKSTTVRVDYATGEKAETKLEYARKKEHVSFSNGVCGGPEALREAKALDRKLGVADKVKYRPIGNGAYAAVFPEGAKDLRPWQIAHQRVDFNGSYGDPVPGTFRDKHPREYQR